MKLPRLLAPAFAAFLLALGFTPALSAQDPSISRELTRIRRALPSPNSNQINFQNLDAAIRVLNGRIPSALRAPSNEAEYNSPGSTATEPQSPLDNLTRNQRSDLVATYQLHIKNLVRVTSGDKVNPRDVADIVSALEDLVSQLEQLAGLPEGPQLNNRVAQLTRFLRPPAPSQPKAAPRPSAPRE